MHCVLKDRTFDALCVYYPNLFLTTQRMYKRTIIEEKALANRDSERKRMQKQRRSKTQNAASERSDAIDLHMKYQSISIV